MSQSLGDSEERATTATKATGQEQGLAVLLSVLLLVGIVVFGVMHRADPANDVPFQDWTWTLITGIQTFFAFLLPVAYPGYAVFAYTAGWGKDGPGTRLEAFYINGTMGMVLGVPKMAMVDHFMFLFAPCVMVLGWMPWPEAQAIASGLGCLCGLYMALWIPTNIATGTKDPGPFILCAAFVTCSFFRVFSPDIAFQGDLNTVLLVFNAIMCLIVLALIIHGIRRASRASHTIALVQRMCADLGEGPVWQSWPKNKRFPTGWWFEPPPGGDKSAWPFGPWPEGPNDANPPEAMIAAAAEEMRREISRFMPLSLVLGVLFTFVGALVVAAYTSGA